MRRTGTLAAAAVLGLSVLGVAAPAAFAQSPYPSPVVPAHRGMAPVPSTPSHRIIEGKGEEVMPAGKGREAFRQRPIGPARAGFGPSLGGGVDAGELAAGGALLAAGLGLGAFALKRRTAVIRSVGV